MKYIGEQKPSRTNEPDLLTIGSESDYTYYWFDQDESLTNGLDPLGSREI